MIISVSAGPTSLLPEQPLGTHSIAIDGIGTHFIAWRDGADIRIQTFNRVHTIILPWFVAFSDANATGELSICPFVSGGLAICYFRSTNEIAYEFIDQFGSHIPGAGGFFSASYDVTFPQIACSTNAIDDLAIGWLTPTGDLKTKIVTGITSNTTAELPEIILNSTPIPAQIAPKEKSFFNLTSNWTNGPFAALYMRDTDGHGIVRKFDRSGAISIELDVLESFRVCPPGGANRGNPCLVMHEASEKLFLVNTIVPLGQATPPTLIRSRVYNETFTGTTFSTIHTNPSPTTFRLNCLGAAYFTSGDSFFVVDDENTKLNLFSLNPSGVILNTSPDIDGTTTYLTTDSSKPAAFGIGDMVAISFHDVSLGSAPGTSLILGIQITDEVHVKGFATRAINMIRVPVLDNNSVTILTNGNTVITGPATRPTTSLDDFIGATDVALIGGPITNLNSAQLFLAGPGQLRTDIDTNLAKYGVQELTFFDLTADGSLIDDRNGSTQNAPKIRAEIPYGTFIMAKHQIGNTIYDYGIALKLDATKRIYIFAGIRDISTYAVSRELVNANPELDAALENFGAALAIVTYPDTVTDVDGFETELLASNAQINFRPVVGIRENSPLI